MLAPALQINARMRWSLTGLTTPYFIIQKGNKMKKAIYFTIVLLLLTGGISAQQKTRTSIKEGNISPTAYVTLSAPITAAAVGSDFTIPITISDTTGLGIIAYQLDLHYDPAVIQPRAVPVSGFGTLSSNLAMVYNPITPGVLKVAVYGATPLSGAGTLFNFNFTAVGPEGSVSTLGWVNPMFNEGNPGVYPNNGQIRITSETSSPTPTDFIGRETLPGTWDALNQVYRNNSFVLASEGQVDNSSMTASFDMVSAEEDGKFKIVDGQWTIVVYENGLYVGSIYGEFFDGRVTQVKNAQAALVSRIITSRFRIKGGIGRFENAGSDDAPSGGFNSTTDYTNGKRTTATLSYIL